MKKWINLYCRLNNIEAGIAQATARSTDKFWFDYGKEQEIVLFSYGLYCEAKQQGRETHPLTSPSAEVKNEWACTSTQLSRPSQG
jgi:hypothetical protein